MDRIWIAMEMGWGVSLGGGDAGAMPMSVQSETGVPC